MRLIFSGEGVTDLGDLDPDGTIQPGPMLLLLLHMVERWATDYGWSARDWLSSACALVPKAALIQKQQALKNNPPAPSERARLKLPTRSADRERGLYYFNAHALGVIAAERSHLEDQTPYVVILFRDCDGTQRSEPQDWQRKWDSMCAGFEAAGLGPLGVPMLPKPKSEAWLLCAVQHRYQGCAPLEDLSGNDASTSSPKAHLERAFGRRYSRKDLCDLFDPAASAPIPNAPHPLDPLRIDIPSFNDFKARLRDALQRAYPQHPPPW